MLEITTEALQKIQSALAAADPSRTHLRILATARGAAYQYKLEAIPADAIDPDDTVLDQAGFSVVLDPKSAAALDGASIDYRETLIESGFRFDNPNQPESPSFASGQRDDLIGGATEKVQLLLDTEINPAVASHGGMVSLVGVKDGTVYVAFGGGCHGCGLVDVTLKQGIEARIKEAVPEISEVVDTTDHSTGERPFFPART